MRRWGGFLCGMDGPDAPVRTSASRTEGEAVVRSTEGISIHAQEFVRNLSGCTKPDYQGVEHGAKMDRAMRLGQSALLVKLPQFFVGRVWPRRRWRSTPFRSPRLGNPSCCEFC